MLVSKVSGEYYKYIILSLVYYITYYTFLVIYRYYISYLILIIYFEFLFKLRLLYFNTQQLVVLTITITCTDIVR